MLREKITLIIFSLLFFPFLCKSESLTNFTEQSVTESYSVKCEERNCKILKRTAIFRFYYSYDSSFELKDMSSAELAVHAIGVSVLAPLYALHALGGSFTKNEAKEVVRRVEKYLETELELDNHEKIKFNVSQLGNILFVVENKNYFYIPENISGVFSVEIFDDKNFIYEKFDILF